MVNFHVTTWKSKICILMGSFCPNHLKFQLKKYRRVVFHDPKEWCKVLKKTDLVSNMTRQFCWFFTQLHESLKISFRWALDLQKYRGVILHDTEERCQIWINHDLVVSKMAWGIGWNFIRTLRSLKNCTLMGSFCSKHIMFQLEYFIEIMCLDT